MANRVGHTTLLEDLEITDELDNDTKGTGCTENDRANVTQGKTTNSAEGRTRKMMNYLKSTAMSFCGLELSNEEKQGWACQQLCIAHHCHMCKGDGKQPVGEIGDNEMRIPLQAPASANSSMRSFVDSASVRATKPHVLKLLWEVMKRGFTRLWNSKHQKLGASQDQLDAPKAKLDEVKAKWIHRQSIEGLLNLKYKYLYNQKDDHYLHQATKRRPYFTYWLMFVHIVIMTITLSVYGFAPYQWDTTTTTAFVQTSSLTLEIAKKNITGSVWGGPDLESLVLLGAKYAPCMRRDKQLYRAIETDLANEAANSGCCVRRDKSGCVQSLSISDCPATYADFYYLYNDTESSEPVRAVCGTSPYTCINPDQFQNPAWKSSVSYWPICSQAAASSYPHLSCELTGRPCCVGLQAKCLITTLEHCTFLGGRYHSDAFLCSQVDCLSAVCGLIPFAVKDHPDQVYRLWLSLFLHAGVFHIILSLLFDFFILRVIEKRLGWLKTCFIYILSGVGGNVVSAVFVPYYPGVGPGSSIFGIVAYIFVFVLMEYPYLERPWIVLITMVTILGISLVAGVLFPFLDNFSHIGGFIFGFFLSWIVVQCKQLNESSLILLQRVDLSQEIIHKSLEDLHNKQKKSLVLKYAMMGISLAASLILFTVCLLWFYFGQDNWFGFIYLNCIPFTQTFCMDYGQSLESRGN